MKLTGVRERRHQPYYDTNISIKEAAPMLESAYAGESAALDRIRELEDVIQNRTSRSNLKLTELLLVAATLAEELGYGPMAYGLRQYEKLAYNMREGS